MDKYFYKKNRERLIQKIGNDETILLFGSSAAYINAKGYYGKGLDMNFFYMTGLEISSFILVMGKDNGKPFESLFIDEKIPFEEKWSGVRMTSEEAANISGVDDIIYLDKFDEYLCDMLGNSKNKTLHLDIPTWHKKDVPAPIKTFIDRVNSDFSGTQITNIMPIINDMRMIKQSQEIDCIKAGVANAKIGIDAMFRAVKPSMNEYNLQAIAHNSLYEIGEMRAIPMVATGSNACILHYPKAVCQIKEEDLVLIDFCPRSNHYASDISRAFPANGKFSKRQNEFYSIALDANKMMIDAAKEGMTFTEMNILCREYLYKGMKAINLINFKDEVEKYYYHNVSHYIGLGIHDVGNIDLPIMENSVLTIDAGVYVAEEGIGLRVEDNVLIKKNKSVNLSTAIAKEIKDIEDIMG